jgi:mono/diheme cytochrome c family protein
VLLRRIASVVLVGGALVLGAALCMKAAEKKPEEGWVAPPDEAKKENPVPADAKSVAAGKVFYTQQCLACHGPTGKGDGPAAIALKTKPGDLSDPKVREQTDGALFWKITEGRTPMPPYKKLLTDQQRWQVVNYIRTFAKKPA